MWGVESQIFSFSIAGKDKGREEIRRIGDEVILRRAFEVRGFRELHDCSLNGRGLKDVDGGRPLQLVTTFNVLDHRIGSYKCVCSGVHCCLPTVSNR